MPLKDNFAEVLTRSGGGQRWRAALDWTTDINLPGGSMAAPMCKIHCNNAAKNSKIVESSTYYFMMLVTSDELRLELDLRISIDFKFLF